MDNLELLLSKQFPVEMIPVRSQPKWLVENGDRFFLGSQVVYLESKRPSFHVMQKIGLLDCATPFGVCNEFFHFKPVPVALMKEFEEYARKQLPNEAAGRFVYIAATDTWRVDIYQPKSVGVGHVKYDIPPLQSSESLGVDIHSHGYFPPKFSPNDDEDDRQETKVAGVISFTKGSTSIQAAFRYCSRGLFIPLSVQLTANEIQLSKESNHG